MNNPNPQSAAHRRKQIAANMGLGSALGLALGNIALGLAAGILVGGVGSSSRAKTK